MNRDPVIQMAWDAGLSQFVGNTDQSEELKRFFQMAQAAEREACAKVCDELHWPWRMGDNSGPKECAAAIRARGETK
jgi:hypothetical protein